MATATFRSSELSAPTRRYDRLFATEERIMRLIALLVGALGVSAVVADEPSEWKEFASKDGRFKVLMSGTPKQYKLDTESDFGKGVLNMNAIQVGKTMYAANYCDFPAGIKKATLKQVYDSGRDGAAYVRGAFEGGRVRCDLIHRAPSVFIVAPHHRLFPGANRL